MGARRTRRELLGAGSAAGVLGAALMGPAGAALLVPAAAHADGSSSRPGPEPASPTAILERLVSVELLLSYCYQHVLSSPMVDSRARRTLQPCSVHEQTHIRTLELQLAARGGTAPQPPADIAVADLDLAHRNVPERLGQLRGARDALGLLVAVERVAIGAYFVALTKLEDPRLIVLASEIMANDAQHEAILGLLLNRGDPTLAVPYGLVQGVQ